MDESCFDHMTRCLAQTRLSRRATLRSGRRGFAAPGLAAFGWSAMGATGASAAPSTQATPQAADSNAIEVDGAWLCEQTFGLCTTAPCETSETDPTIANCQCVVEESYAIGFKSCAERAPVGTTLYSNFSTANVNSAFSVLTYPEDAPWANCLDVPCEIDAFNPAMAVCQCQIVDTGPSLTFGGGCDTDTCTSIIWSAAPPSLLGLAQYEAGMQQVNQAVTLPPACPTPRRWPPRSVRPWAASWDPGLGFQLSQ